MYDVKWERTAFDKWIDIWAWKRREQAWVVAVLQVKDSVDHSLQVDPLKFGKPYSADLYVGIAPLHYPAAPFKLKVYFRIENQRVTITNVGLTI